MAAAKAKAAAPKPEEPETAAPETAAPAKQKVTSISEDNVQYVILLDRKKHVRCYCSSKEGVARALESLSAKEREKAYVFQLTSVKLETKVNVVWE